MDMLATPDDLRSLLGETAATLPDTRATVLIELGTAEVQAAAGQRLVLIADDEITLLGTTESWLALPQRPVSAATVEIDGDAVTDFQRYGARLWRSCGWSTSAYEPCPVAVTYTHGYAPDDAALGLARRLTLAVASQLAANPSGATGFSIDDYREQYSQAADAASGALPKASRELLRRTYGGRVGLVRIG